MDAENEELVFDLELRTKEVKIAGEDYVLRELTGSQRDKYLNSNLSRIRFNSEGKPAGMKSVEGVQLDLLAQTLYKDDKQVNPEAVKNWPSRVVNALFELSQDLSGLKSEEDESKAKNDSEASS